MNETVRGAAIIGGGPAGLTAGLYLGRARVDAVLLEKQLTGGQAIYTPLIENFPGFPEGIDGTELADRMKEQADRFGLETMTFSAVEGIEVREGVKTLVLESGTSEASAVIVASGRSPGKLGIPGEFEFTGRGISYCATCDGPLFRDRPVMVVGGGDAAVEEGLHLARFASRVIVVHRRDRLRASTYLQERAFADPVMEFMWNTELVEVRGEQTVSSALVRNNVTGEVSVVPVSGVFLYVGNVPNTGFLQGLVELDKSGYVITDEDLQASVPGIFAAGDVRANRFKQVVVAAAEGALAAWSAQRYLETIGVREAYEGGH